MLRFRGVIGGEEGQDGAEPVFPQLLHQLVLMKIIIIIVLILKIMMMLFMLFCEVGLTSALTHRPELRVHNIINKYEWLLSTIFVIIINKTIITHFPS